MPFDYAVPFHMLVAGTGGVLALVHTLCHIIDYAHAVSQHCRLLLQCIIYGTHRRISLMSDVSTLQ